MGAEKQALGNPYFTSCISLSHLFFPPLVLFIGYGVLLPLLTLTISFPLLTFLICPAPVTQEITKAKNDDGRVEHTIEVTIFRRAEVEEEQLQFVNLQIAILQCDYFDQLLRLIDVRHFLYSHEQTCLLHLGCKPYFCRSLSVEFVQRS